MKLTNILLAAALVFVGCRSDSSLADTIGDQTIHYQVEGNKYAVVIVEDGVSQKEAKEYAMKKAAEVARDNGYRYFTIESEGEVAVAKSEKDFPSEQSMPRNLYYELIQSGNFGRDRVTSGDVAPVGMYNGYRMVFSCYKEAPSGRAVDACKYTDCK